MSDYRGSLGTGRLSRRHLLSMMGAAALGGVAVSCGGAGAGTTAASSGTTGSGRKSSPGLFQAAYPYNAPPKGNFNYLPGVSNANTMGYIYDLILLPGAMYYWASQKYFYLLADPSTTLSSDGTTLTYRVRPGLKWSDGSALTAKDVYTTWTLEYILGNAAYTYVDDVSMTDGMTVVFHFSQPSPIGQYYVLRGQIVADSVYGQYMAEAEPLVKQHVASADLRVVRLNQKISAFEPKEVTASGPFNIDMSRVTNQSLSLVRNPHGYGLDKVHFDKMTVWNGTSDEDVMPLELSRKIDYATYGFTVADVREFETLGFRVLRPPTYFGGALFINFATRPEFADKRARQALAYAIDRSKVGAAAEGKSGKTVKYMAGFSDVEVPKWLSAADQARLIRYDHDTKKAASLLIDAGWKRSGGRWLTPSGAPAKYNLKTVSQDADLTANAKSIQSQLGTFGFDITVIEEDGTQLGVDVGDGRFDWAILTWGSAGNPFPTAAFANDVLTYDYPATKPNKGIDFPLQQTTSSVGSIDFGTAIPDSGQGPNLESLKSKVTKLALAFNELLPILPSYERYGNNPVDTKHVTGWPSDGDPIYQNSIYADNFVTILMYQGVLKPASNAV